MEEKIIEAKFKKNKYAIIVLLLSIIIFGVSLIEASKYYPYARTLNNIYDSLLDFYFTEIFCVPLDYLFCLLFYFGLICIAVSFLFMWEMNRCSLTITNRRVTGKASFGKSVDLPLNQISAVALGIFSRITVATSSGKIHFWLIDNRAEIHAALTDIIGKVQIGEAYTQNNSTPKSSADELKKYKELLDSGAITQEEFDKLKQQLLGL